MAGSSYKGNVVCISILIDVTIGETACSVRAVRHECREVVSLNRKLMGLVAGYFSRSRHHEVGSDKIQTQYRLSPVPGDGSG